MPAAKPKFNTVQIREGKYFAVAINEQGKIAAEVEFKTLAEAQEHCRKSQDYA